MPAIAVWEDDPLSASPLKPVRRQAPALGAGGLALSFVGKAPEARVHPVGTPGFRYWNAAEALSRTVRCWGRVLRPDTRWHAGKPLGVDLDAGRDLNAYYDRQEICFFHETVRGVTVYSGESPDVLCHELGHAILDAVRPQLWNAASIEVASLHESFADITAMLSALEVDSVRAMVVAATEGRLARASRLSRLAEQLGWAIRQSHPDAVDPDCLRNAANSFFYRQPESLPPMAPASSLSSEPHSFSRVFTAAWLESLAGMFDAGAPTSSRLAAVAADAGKLLVSAVARARITSSFFAQVAAGLLAADADLCDGRYRAAIQRAFVGRGILSMASAASLPRIAAAGKGGGRLRPVEVTVDGRAYGLRVRRLLVEAPLGPSRESAASAAPDLGSMPAAEPHVAGRAFVEACSGAAGSMSERRLLAALPRRAPPATGVPPARRTRWSGTAGRSRSSGAVSTTTRVQPARRGAGLPGRSRGGRVSGPGPRFLRARTRRAGPRAGSPRRRGWTVERPLAAAPSPPRRRTAASGRGGCRMPGRPGRSPHARGVRSAFRSRHTRTRTAAWPQYSPAPARDARPT
ncbi:MAG TPA: hypothetical protein PLE61_06850 [Vicinamibacterales bacterium]|nr:hypothetical protein [Vicinamibacterales bacterium]HPW20517.1 hypothetical protein [Vicinamibacterales bacterium]